MKNVLTIACLLFISFSAYHCAPENVKAETNNETTMKAAAASINAVKDNTKEANTVKWYTWDEAVAAIAENPKPMFIDFYTNWCGWCKRMDKDTFQKSKIAKQLNKDFYPVKFNAEQKEDVVFGGTTYKFVKNGRRGYHELAAAILQNRLSYPTTVFLTSEFKIIQVFPGYKKPDQFQVMMDFAKGGYLNSNWAEFNK